MKSNTVWPRNLIRAITGTDLFSQSASYSEQWVVQHEQNTFCIRSGFVFLHSDLKWRGFCLKCDTMYFCAPIKIRQHLNQNGISSWAENSRRVYLLKYTYFVTNVRIGFWGLKKNLGHKKYEPLILISVTMFTMLVFLSVQVQTAVFCVGTVMWYKLEERKERFLSFFHHPAMISPCGRPVDH